MNCPECKKSGNIQRRGFNHRKDGTDVQRYMCLDCRTWFSQDDIEEDVFQSDLKVAVIDVETLPSQGFFWGIWEQNISQSQITKDGCLLSWGAKLLNSADATGQILTSKEAVAYDFERITRGLWDYMSSITHVIGHNFEDFDRKVINTAFLLVGLPPLKYKIIDTLKVARGQFKFSSNKMAFINDRLGIRNKISNEGFALWRGCSEGDKKSLDTMMEYNLGDLYANEEMYYRLRPYIFNHPDLSLYNSITERQCPCCLSTDLVIEGKYPPTAKGLYESVRCKKCGSLNRLNVNLVGKEKRSNILSR